MKTGIRLGAYAAALAVAFGAAFMIAGAVVPDSVVAGWAADADTGGHGDTGHGTAPDAAGETLPGLSLSAGGYTLAAVEAPGSANRPGTLSFQIHDTAGKPVTDYAVAHEKQLHLIVVRSDGAEFRHVHPELDATTGTWSLPWQWGAAGTYRIYADFTPENGAGLTLTRTVNVAGAFTPADPQPRRFDTVDGYTVSLTGDLTTGTTDLTIRIERDGTPVTTLQPYLGAFGHLVALRQGDLAYLHVHADGEEPQPGDTAGPMIGFAAEAPTPGRYLLYLDFQIDDQVHTATFVLDAHDAA